VVKQGAGRKPPPFLFSLQDSARIVKEGSQIENVEYFAKDFCILLLKLV
jgi:hypothetical protein